MRDHKTRQIRKDRPPIHHKRGQFGSDRNAPHHNIGHYKHPSPWVHHKKRPSQIQLPQINRKQQCPFLMRTFYCINDENNYDNNALPEEREIKLHLWPNSTLKQIIQLLRVMVPNLRSKQKYTFGLLRFNKDWISLYEQKALENLIEVVKTDQVSDW